MEKVIERLRVMRRAEGFSDVGFAMQLGIPFERYVDYEDGGHAAMPFSDLLKITTHPRFARYTLWLLTGQTELAVLQVAPETGASSG